MKKNKLAIITIIVLIILIGSLTVYQQTEVFTAETSNDEILDVALIVPLTGKASDLGTDFVQGFELAIKENQIENITLHIEDTQTNPKNAITGLNKLISTSDIDIIVTLQAQVSRPASSVAKTHNIPIVATLTTLKDFAKNEPNNFLAYPLPEQEVIPLVEFSKNAQIENIAMLTVQDEFGETMRTTLPEYFEGNITANETFAISEQDFRIHLLKIRETNPDAIMIIGYPPHINLFLKQKSELGYDLPVLGVEQLQSDLIRSKSIQYMENTYASTPVALINTKEENKFVRSFENEYDSKPDFMAPFGYDIALIFSQIKDPNNARDELTTISIEGVNGLQKFNNEGEIELEMVVVNAQNREVVN